METNELKDLWNDYNRKLNRILVLNNQVLVENRLRKSKSEMKKLLWFRVMEAVLFLLIVIALWSYIASNFTASAPVISAFILNIFAHIGLVGTIGQIALISRVDYSQPVLVIQKDIAKIRTHGIQLLKIFALSIPFYLAYIFFGAELLWGIDLFIDGDSVWLVTHVVFSFLLCFPVYWLIKQLSESPVKHYWIKKLIEGSGMKHINSVTELLDEIEDFESEYD